MDADNRRAGMQTRINLLEAKQKHTRKKFERGTAKKKGLLLHMLFQVVGPKLGLTRKRGVTRRGGLNSSIWPFGHLVWRNQQ